MSPQKQSQSTGPRPEAGGARSSQNSIRHSLCSKKHLIVPEDRPEFDLFYAEMIQALAPEGVIECTLAEAIVMIEWRLTRAIALENQIFIRGYMNSKDQFVAGAETWLAHSKEIATITLYEQRINRVLTLNKAEFEARKSARQASGADLPVWGTPVPHPGALPTTQSQSPEVSQPPAQPVESKSESTAPAAAGFVRSSAQFVCSSSSIAPTQAHLAPAETLLTTPEPLVSPPAALRHAA